MSNAGRPRKKPLPKRIAGGILRLLAGRPQGEPKLKPKELRRVLLIRYDKIGDMVITTPLIEALHRIAPQAEIDVLAGKANAGLIEYDPRIRRIHIWEKSLFKRIRTIRECRREGYDLTLQLLLWRTTLPGLLAGLLTPRGRVVGKDDPNNRSLFNHTIRIDASRHYSLQVFDFFAGSLNLDRHDATMPLYKLHIPEQAEKEVENRLAAEGIREGEFILLNISAGEGTRELPDERNAELIERLKEIAAHYGLRVAVTGAPTDAERINAIISRVNEKNRGNNSAKETDVVPLLFNSLIAAAACIGKARLIVTPDTGTNHIASAMGTPTVAFFTKNGRPIGWGPRGVHHKIVQATEGKDASALKVEEIAEAAEEVLKGEGAGDRGRKGEKGETGEWSAAICFEANQFADIR